MAMPNVPRSGQSAEDKGIRFLSEVSAISAIFFGAGPLFRETIEPVVEFSALYYGSEYHVYVNVGWALVCAAFLYGLIRTVSSTVFSILRARGLASLLLGRGK